MKKLIHHISGILPVAFHTWRVIEQLLLNVHFQNERFSNNSCHAFCTQKNSVCADNDFFSWLES